MRPNYKNYIGRNKRTKFKRRQRVALFSAAGFCIGDMCPCDPNACDIDLELANITVNMGTLECYTEQIYCRQNKIQKI